MQPGWCQPVRQEFMENDCEALPGVAYPGVRDNRSTINTKTGYDDDDPQRAHKRLVNVYITFTIAFGIGSECLFIERLVLVKTFS